MWLFLVQDLRLDKRLSPFEFGYQFLRIYGIYNTYGTVSIKSLAYGYEDFQGHLSTIDGFSSGGPSAKNCRYIYQQHYDFPPMLEQHNEDVNCVLEELNITNLKSTLISALLLRKRLFSLGLKFLRTN